MAALAAVLLLATASAAGAAAEQLRSLQVHNPSGVTVTAVHMVLSSHFDGGCKVSAHTLVCWCTVAGGPSAQAAAHATLPTRQPDTAPAMVVLSPHTATGFA